MKNNWIKHIKSTVFFALLLAILFVPAAKAALIQGLMEIGLLKPSISDKSTIISTDLSAIKFKDIKGKIISLEDLKGKIVFINFWATWCPPCLAEMPSVNRLYQQFKNYNDIVFLLVDADNNFAKANDYMSRKQYDLPIYHSASSIPETIFKGALPTTIVLDKKGRISFNGEGAANYSSPKFIAFIKKLQQQKD